MLPTAPNDADPLERYGHNLTRFAQQGAFSPLAGQDSVVARVFQVLQRKRKCNPVLLASDEIRRWPVVAEVIRRMAVGEAPDPFPKQQVIALDYEALFTNLSDDTSLRQKRKEQMHTFWSKQFTQLEQEPDKAWFARVKDIPLWPSLEEYIAPTMALERLQSIFIAIQNAPASIILFIDHFHRLLGGDSEHYPLYAFSLLKPALRRHQIQLIGACTLEQYQSYIEPDSSIHGMCQEICLPQNVTP